MTKSFSEIMAELLQKELNPPEPEQLPDIDFASNQRSLPEAYKPVALKGKIVYRRGPGALPKYPRYTIDQIDKRIEEL